MLCLKAEGVGRDMYAGVILPVNLGSSLQKAMRRGGGGSLSSSSPSYSAASGDGSSAACSRFSEDVKSIDGGGKGAGRGQKMCNYRFQLEQEVQILQKQLQEEIDLHVALATAVGHSTMPLLNSPSRVPDKAQELLANIAALEITVSKLEEELTALHFRLSHERNERRLAETHLKYLPSLPLELPSLSMEPLCSTSGFMWEEHISSLRASKFSGCQMSPSMKLDFVSGNGHSLLATSDRTSAKCPIKEESDSCGRSIEEKETSGSLHQTVATDQKKSSSMKNLWQHPNQLSEEMVRCMRNIFLCLSESSGALSKLSASQCLPSPSSPAGHLSRSSLTSVSDSSLIISSVRSPSTELHDSSEDAVLESSFDPYRVNRKVNWRNIGSYSLAAEVSWMSVGKAELEYAAEALKKFRFLVEQLAEVNPSQMSNDEKLAFWINLYNALIMHAYLAYGVPRSDIKLFSLMQKASYTIGGQSFSAADIEFVILKMKPPTHRPQIALVLAIHKFKISEEHRKYSVDSSEPLVMFALSCGMYSAPAVRIFTAQHVHDELQKSMRDYIQASVGISDKGKLLVPKLLHCFAKGVVEDSLLVDWICRYLTPDQVTVVRDSTSQRKQRLLGVRSFSILPFDLRFRYLYLPDSSSSHDIIPTYGASIGRLAEI